MFRRITLYVGTLSIAVSLIGSSATAFAAGRIYWANFAAPATGSISYANLDGSGAKDLTVTGASLEGPAGLTMDPATGKIYWVGADTDKISYSDIDGSNGGTLNATGASIDYPDGITIYNGKAYVSNSNSNKISWVNIDGSGGGDLNTGAATVSQPSGIVLDPDRGRVYWANNDVNEISYANIDGSGGGDLATGAATVDQPGAGVIDPNSGRIYWGNWGTFRGISYANLDGSGGGDLNITSPVFEFVVGLAIDVEVGRLYWANYGFTPIANMIQSAKLDGSDGATLNTTGATNDRDLFPFLLKPPTGTAVPTVSGSSSVGSNISCSNGSWAADVIPAFLFRSPRSFDFQWSRDGTEIAGETQASITATTSGGYTCRVTASNAGGSTSQTSTTHTVNAAPASPTTTTAPVTPAITAAKVSPKRSKKTRKRAVFSMQVSQDAKIVVAIQRKYGRLVDGKCRSTTSSNRNHTRCLIYKTVRTLTRNAKAGKVTVTLNAKNLSPGAYSASITASNGNGTSKPTRVLFYQPW